MKKLRYLFSIFLTSCTTANINLKPPEKTSEIASNFETKSEPKQYLNKGEETTTKSSAFAPLKEQAKEVIPYAPEEVKDSSIKKGINPKDPTSYLLPKKEFILEFKEDKNMKDEDKKTETEKEAFLNYYYNYFKENIVYGNEILALNKITFHHKTKDQYSGVYYGHSKNIIIYFYKEKTQKYIETVLTHEYYHHIMRTYFHSEMNHQDGNMQTFIAFLRHLSEKPYIYQTFKLFGDTRYEDKKKGQSRSYAPAFAMQLIKEMKNIIGKFGDEGDGFIKFDKRLLNTKLIRLFMFVFYLFKESEFFARSLTYQTIALDNQKSTSDDKPFNVAVKNYSLLDDFYHHIILKGNPYYKYEVPRKWPSESLYRDVYHDDPAKCENGESSCIVPTLDEDPNNIITMEIPKLKTSEELEKQFLKYQKMFNKEIYNTDQLLSNAFFYTKDKKFQLVLTTNQKVDVFLERVDGKDTNYDVHRLKDYDNNFWLKRPFNKAYRKDFEVEQYPIRFGNLAPGKYKIKINGEYVKKGLNLHNSLEKSKTLWWYYDFNDQGSAEGATDKAIFTINEDDPKNPFIQLEINPKD